MARNGWGKGGDRATDGRAGDRGESRNYTRTYDIRSETEFSNRPEAAIQVRQASIAQEVARAQDDIRTAALRAQSRVHLFPAVGKFVIPEENSWAAHAELIKDPSQNLAFNPDKFVYFDKIIADRLAIPALTDRSHPDYAEYEGLRVNLAVMRNDLIGMYLDDESFDPGDEVHIPKLVGIASAIADGFKHDSWLRRPFTRSLSLDVAKVEATGAVQIYLYLKALETKSWGMFEGLHSRFNDLLRIPNRAWGIDEIEDTPFSETNMMAPPPLQKHCFTPEDLAAACTVEVQQLSDFSEHTARVANNLGALETLEAPENESSVAEARRILRFLHNLQLGERDVETWIDLGTPDEEVAKARALSRLVDIYSGELYKAAQRQPGILSNQLIKDASEAAGAVALGMSVHAINSLPDNHSAIRRLDVAIDAMPESWDQRSAQSVHRLLDTIEAGLRHTMGQDVSDKSPADRLVEMSARIRRTARKLQRVEDMELPAREESIELAREILRRMKLLAFSDKPIDELVQSGNVENKAEFAHKIDEMVESYRSLLAEAVHLNPDIMKDPRIKDANDAVGSFANAVSLMAAKEIPTSIAAAQQISAEITQMPGEWKDLNNKTVDRLVTSMEGGLEQAVSDLEIQAQQQDQEKGDEQIAQEALEASLANGQYRRRKKRRSSGYGSATHRKTQLAINADDYALGQGRFRNTGQDQIQAPMQQSPNMHPSPVGLRPEDLAAVHLLGGNLQNIRNQAANLAPPVEIAAGDQIAPDDKNFTQRERDPKPSSRNKTQRDRI